MSNFFINASNIHNGGGSVLLKEILSELPNEMTTFLLHDSRLKINYKRYKNIIFREIKPNIFSRFISELWIYNNSKKEDIVLCFGNLPPFLKLRSYVILFLQNRFLIDEIKIVNFLSFYTRLRIYYEKIILNLFKDNVDRYIVQTQSMQELLKNNLQKESLKIPFISSKFLFVDKEQDAFDKTIYDFIYVASADKHKNHINLIKAWIHLSKEDIYPSLSFTLNKKVFKNLIKNNFHHNEIVNLKIYNIEIKKSDSIRDIYKKGKALIFPSLIESFGLPLMEAKKLGMPIIASELDYVRDIIDPDFTFDPKSPKSIARAVKRFFKISDSYDDPISPSIFINKLLKRKI